MKITIESRQEALALAAALLEYTREGLRSAGALVHRDDEDPYYTGTREFLRALEKAVKRGEV